MQGGVFQFLYFGYNFPTKKCTIQYLVVRGRKRKLCKPHVAIIYFALKDDEKFFLNKQENFGNYKLIYLSHNACFKCLIDRNKELDMNYILVLIKFGKERAMSLIEDAKNKNPDAFEQLIQPQLQRMYRVAISMLHNEEDAADAIQETVLKCWQKIGQLKSEEYFGTWLTRILINQCKDILKERKKVVPLEEFPELIHEDHYFTNEWRKILSNLNGKYQIVMELYYVDGFSTKEIARILHITEVNVRSRMVRGRKQLEQILTVSAMD